ncbi:endonuclease domain-containing protein [Streptomyces sp. NPDC056713]|uniref:endonuclease domain-containing protein n=1 Tax=Streptomyces sp. NPDC056713 TaxID=3345921 RepID=UPI003682A580
MQVQAMQLTGSMYGLRLDQVRLIRALPACMICQSTDSGFESGIFAVDHCHDSGVVRGALCQGCNFMLGNARDSVEVLLAAIKYLTKDHSSEPWNQGKTREEEATERRELRLEKRLEQTKEELRITEDRVKELEAVMAQVDEDVAFAARRRVRNADALDKFISEMVAPASLNNAPIAASDLRDAWRQWSGGASCPVQSLYEALQKLGGVQRRTARGIQWQGIILVSSPTDAR